MAWNRQAPELGVKPLPPSISRWAIVLLGALFAGVLLFLLYAAFAPLQRVNVWLLCAMPALTAVLALAARAYKYGGALGRFEYQQAMAVHAQQAWQAWGQQGMAVLASCLMLPDQVSASAVMPSGQALPSRMGQVRRLDKLQGTGNARMHAAIEQLMDALDSQLSALSPDPNLNVTLLTDVAPDEYAAVREQWVRSWARLNTPLQPASITVAAALSPQWIDEQLKVVSTAIELVVVLQISGGRAYSDGLAALVLSPRARAEKLGEKPEPLWLRPMPLQAESLEQEFALYVRTQTPARDATSLLADRVDWQPLMVRLLAAGHDSCALTPNDQVILETLCGLPGPLGHWLASVLAIELARRREQPLLLLTLDGPQRWISTITLGHRYEGLNSLFGVPDGLTDDGIDKSKDRHERHTASHRYRLHL
ncbi:MAG: hypothetical protein ACRER8_04360 [Pseudomonas sp.]|uniref:hypothetical protein n=1 Tax=Pseudomonas sp. TaxID=306 RepID=UPI003D6EB343